MASDLLSPYRGDVFSPSTPVQCMALVWDSSSPSTCLSIMESNTVPFVLSPLTQLLIHYNLFSHIGASFFFFCQCYTGHCFSEPFQYVLPPFRSMVHLSVNHRNPFLCSSLMQELTGILRKAARERGRLWIPKPLIGW